MIIRVAAMAEYYTRRGNEQLIQLDELAAWNSYA
jgi:hypothetical protein